MRLGALQDLLREFYALDVEYEVDDFVTSDATLARALDGGGRQLDEKLLIAEGGGEAEVSLYLGAQLLERLDRSDPLTRLDADNLEDFWTAFEGVSHFTYYAWNAQLEKPVTLLEMELQAEVDKYIATTLLLARQGQRASHGLHHWLFGLTHLDDRLDGPERDRYRNANHYAGKYCRKLATAVARDANDERVQTELRRFYRYSQTSKIDHIESASR
jgi:hypothetical protein